MVTAFSLKWTGLLCLPLISLFIIPVFPSFSWLMEILLSKAQTTSLRDQKSQSPLFLTPSKDGGGIVLIFCSDLMLCSGKWSLYCCGFRQLNFLSHHFYL